MEIDYKDFIPSKTSRIRENIEWSTTYSYNATDTTSPRVMLIGDSICNAYHRAVRDKLAERANVSFWASSKCVTDPDYFRELDFMLSMYPYTIICFNNGLHSLKTDIAEWREAYRSAVRFIRAKLPETALTLILCTALNNPDYNAAARRLNAIILETAEEYGLPVIDLYTPTDALDKDTEMSDTFHFKAPAVNMQADILAAHIAANERIAIRKGLNQSSTETGPDGSLK